MLTLVNDERAKAGCGALRTESSLQAAAQAHATDMVRRTFFDHVNPDGESPSDRARRAGFDGGAGENIAVGQPGPAEVVQGWMNSPGHRSNILDCSSTLTGVGYDPREVMERYSPGSWVQMFSR